MAEDMTQPEEAVPGAEAARVAYNEAIKHEDHTLDPADWGTSHNAEKAFTTLIAAARAPGPVGGEA